MKHKMKFWFQIFLLYFKYNSFNSPTKVLSNEQLSFSSNTNNITLLSNVLRIVMYNVHTGSSTGTKSPMNNPKYLINTNISDADCQIFP